MSKREIDHEYTENIVCPYCGYEDEDSFEQYVDEDEKLISCDSCNKKFYATRNIEVTYSTDFAKYATCSVCGNKKVVVENCSAYGTKVKQVGVDCCMHKEKERLFKEFIERRDNK